MAFQLPNTTAVQAAPDPGELSRPPVTTSRASPLNARLVISPGCTSRWSTRPVGRSTIRASRPDRNATRLPSGLATSRTAVWPTRPIERTRRQLLTSETAPIPLRTATTNLPATTASATGARPTLQRGSPVAGSSTRAGPTSHERGPSRRRLPHSNPPCGRQSPRRLTHPRRGPIRPRSANPI